MRLDHYLDEMIKSEGSDPINIVDPPQRVIVDIKVEIIHQDLIVYCKNHLPSDQKIEDLSYRTLIRIIESDPALVLENGENLYEEGRDFKVLEHEKIEICNPDFDLPVLDDVRKQKLLRLQNKIDKAIKDLSSEERSDIEEKHLLDSPRGIPQNYLTVNSNVFDRSIFVDLLVSLKTQNEDSFIQAMKVINTIFKNLGGSKEGFIIAFTHLFITGKFPTPAWESEYAHFVLRCGQIH